MYSVNDKKSVIRDLQRFLLVIGEKSDIPYLSIDGIYSEETEAAVRSFQEMHRYEVTGFVDKNTFDAIYEEYIQTLKSADARIIEFDKNEFPLKIGDAGNVVAHINTLIRELSAFYTDLPITHGDFYSQNTENAIKLLQGYFRLSETGETSLELLDRIKKEAEERQNFSTLNIP